MELTQTQLIVIVSILAVLTLWDVVWKAMAMWVVCKRESKLWFVILLVVNSVGILPIAYLWYQGALPTRKKKVEDSEEKGE